MTKTSPRVLIYSRRTMAQWLASSAFYEFEDLVAGWGDNRLISPADPEYYLRRKINTTLNRSLGRIAGRTGHAWANALTPPCPSPWRPEGDYDLFFAVLPAPQHSFGLKDLAEIRKRCRHAVCYIPEVWAVQLEQEPYYLEPLKLFDRIFVSTHHSVDTMARLSGRPTSFLPFAVDALTFARTDPSAPRPIDVLSVGRRSPVTHEALVTASRSSDLFYYYDTVAAPQTRDHLGHSFMYATLLQRSVFALSNRANADEPEKTAGAQEVGHRFFEAAAAGAVMIGDPPDSPAMANAFDWPDAITPAPWHAPDMPARLARLARDPVSLDRRRRTGMVACLRRHDWVHRWLQILDSVGLAPGPLVDDRLTALDRRACEIEGSNEVGASSDNRPPALRASL